MSAYRGNQITASISLISAFRAVLQDDSLDPAMVALMLQLPSQAYLSEIAEQIDVEAIHFARQYLRTQVAEALVAELEQAYQRCQSDASFSPDAASVAQRSLKNTVLSYLMQCNTLDSLALAQAQLDSASNMTDELAALAALVNSEAEGADGVREKALANFYQRWQNEALVVNQWLLVQAQSLRPQGLTRVQALMKGDAFDIKNPNKVRSLIGAFCNGNPINFHLADGSGYEFLAEQIITLNELNPQVAARQLTPLTKWRKYDAGRQQFMRAALERILAQPDLSKDVFEVVSKSLKE